MSHQRYLTFANEIAQELSKDPSTKVGAFLLQKEHNIPISWGYNGMPRGLNDAHLERLERPEKYKWFEHGERNAIFNAVRPLLEGKMILTPRVPDMESARAIVSVGIKQIVLPCVGELEERLAQLFQESGVELIELDRGIHPKTAKLKKYMKLTKKMGVLWKEKELPNSQGVLILDKDTFASVSQGVDGLPYGIRLEHYLKMEEKDRGVLLESAEKNAIYNAARRVLAGGTAYSVFIPCIDCARALLACGIKEVVSPRPTDFQERDVRWKHSFEVTQKIFALCGVELIFEEIQSPIQIEEDK